MKRFATERNHPQLQWVIPGLRRSALRAACVLTVSCILSARSVNENAQIEAKNLGIAFDHNLRSRVIAHFEEKEMPLGRFAASERVTTSRGVSAEFPFFSQILWARQVGVAANSALIESTKSEQDVAPRTDPSLPFWQDAPPVAAEFGPFGKPLPRYRTEIRSRWTDKNLYFLFVCPYEQLNLKPSPSTLTETYRLWDWDVAEVFIGSDFRNIRRYKEFEISPQGEWVDLDIDLIRPHHEDGWRWNSGFTVTARIDTAAKVWYGAMRIPFPALEARSPSVGDEFRVNFFRSQGPPPDRVQIVWQPTMKSTFHVPEKFGLLRLVATTNGPLQVSKSIYKEVRALNAAKRLP
jgi:hypothetical protein